MADMGKYETMYRQLTCNSNVGSNHFWRNNFYHVPDIKSPNNQSCFSHFFPRIFFSFSSWKRKQTLIGPNSFFLSYGPIYQFTNSPIHQFIFFYQTIYLSMYCFFWIEIIKSFLNLERVSKCISQNHENNCM